jgi:hypothetical protein
LQDLGQDPLLQLGQRLGHQGGQLILLGGAARQSGRNHLAAADSVGAVIRARATWRTHGRHLSPDPVVLHAQHDQLIDRDGIQVAGDYGDDHRVARDGPGRAAVQPGPAVTGGHRRSSPVRGPPGSVFADPRVLQRRVLIHRAEFSKGNVDQRLDRLPGPLGQQIRSQQPSHRLRQRVVVALRPGAQVPAAGRGGQGVQHRLHHRRALRREVAVDDPGPLERCVKRHPAVQVLILLIVRVWRRGPVPDLRADRGERPQVRPGPGRRHHDLLGPGPELPGDGPGPPGQLQRLRLGEHPALGQGGRQHRVAAGQRLHRPVLGGLPAGDPRRVDQPGPGGPLPVSHRTVLRVERLQVPSPQRRPDRVHPFQRPQPPGQHLGWQLGRVLPGQAA